MDGGNAGHGAGHAARAWQAGEFGWGIFGIPEREFGVLGGAAGLEVVELLCALGWPGLVSVPARGLRVRGPQKEAR